MQRVVIVYDISSNKRRKKVSNLLEGYGIRVNRSVFECRFKNKKTRQNITKELLKLINSKLDSLRIYTVCEKCLNNSEAICNEPQPFEIDAIYWI